MYQKFFGLTRSPFEISPDPYSYYGSAKHNEALAPQDRLQDTQ